MKRNWFRLMICFMLVLTMTIAPVTTASAAGKPMRLLKLNVEDARLRDSASNIIDTLKRGEKVLYSGKNSGYNCLICTADGEIGYVYREFLSSYGVVLSDQVYYTTSGGVKMYKKASTGASSVARLGSHSLVLVYKTSGNWGYARTLSGRAGFIQMNKLDRFL